MRRFAPLLAVVLVALAAAPASAQEPPGKRSDRVSYTGFLAEPNVISARFRDGLMYVSSERGLSIYDVRDAARPRLVGQLPLPNFENEDIDVGGGIALISNDPSEGVGRLWVIDVRDPTAPRIRSSMATGSAFPTDLGPIGKGTGHTASCIQDCSYVYLAGTGSGIDIVDLRDKDAPKYATPANFRALEATGGLASHDVQVDRRGLAWVAGAGGTAAYDVSNPALPKLVHRTDRSGDSRYDETFGTDDGSTLNDFIHHNSMRIQNSSLRTPDGPLDADSSVVAVTEEDYNRPTCRGAGSFQTWRITNETRRGDLKDANDEGGPAVQVLRNLDRWDVEIDPSRQSLCSAHYFDDRAGLVAQGWYEQGVRFLDISDPADIRQVGFFIPTKTLMWGALYPPTDPTGEVVYALDNARGIDVLRFDRPDPGEPPLPTVVAPPANASSSGGGGALRPNVRLRLTDGRRTVKRGQRRSYRLRVRHVAGPEARDLELRLDLPKSVRLVRATGKPVRRARRLTFRMARLAPGKSRSFRVVVRVRRRAKAPAVLLISSVRAADDADPRDNRAIDRNRFAGRRSKRARKATRAQRDHALARRNTLMRAVGTPAIEVKARAVRTAWGWVCRLGR